MPGHTAPADSILSSLPLLSFILFAPLFPRTRLGQCAARHACHIWPLALGSWLLAPLNTLDFLLHQATPSHCSHTTFTLTFHSSLIPLQHHPHSAPPPKAAPPSPVTTSGCHHRPGPAPPLSPCSATPQRTPAQGIPGESRRVATHCNKSQCATTQMSATHWNARKPQADERSGRERPNARRANARR